MGGRMLRVRGVRPFGNRRLPNFFNVCVDKIWRALHFDDQAWGGPSRLGKNTEFAEKPLLALCSRGWRCRRERGQ